MAFPRHLRLTVDQHINNSADPAVFEAAELRRGFLQGSTIQPDEDQQDQQVLVRSFPSFEHATFYSFVLAPVFGMWGFVFPRRGFRIVMWLFRPKWLVRYGVTFREADLEESRRGRVHARHGSQDSCLATKQKTAAALWEQPRRQLAVPQAKKKRMCQVVIFQEVFQKASRFK